MAELVGSNHLTVRNTNLTTTDWNADNLLIGDMGVIDDGTIGSIQENKQLDALVAQLRCAVRFSDTKQINPKTLE